MRFSQSILIVAVATMAMIVSAGSAMAHINGSTLNMIAPDFHSYTGAWPVTVTGSQFDNGTACLTLTQTAAMAAGRRSSWTANGTLTAHSWLSTISLWPRS